MNFSVSELFASQDAYFPVALAILGDRQGRKQRTGGRGLNGAFADYTLIKSPSLSLHSTPLPPWFYPSTFLLHKPLCQSLKPVAPQTNNFVLPTTSLFPISHAVHYLVILIRQTLFRKCYCSSKFHHYSLSFGTISTKFGQML